MSQLMKPIPQTCLILSSHFGPTTAADARKAVFAEDFKSYQPGDFEGIKAPKAEPKWIFAVDAAGASATRV